MKTITELVKDNKVRFTHARKGNLWYVTENEQFAFPVPFSEVGDATYKDEDKALFFMRFMRKYIATEEGKEIFEKLEPKKKPFLSVEEVRKSLREMDKTL